MISSLAPGMVVASEEGHRDTGEWSQMPAGAQWPALALGHLQLLHFIEAEGSNFEVAASWFGTEDDDLGNGSCDTSDQRIKRGSHSFLCLSYFLLMTFICAIEPFFSHPE